MTHQRFDLCCTPQAFQHFKRAATWRCSCFVSDFRRRCPEGPRATAIGSHGSGAAEQQCGYKHKVGHCCGLKGREYSLCCLDLSALVTPIMSELRMYYY